MLVAIDYVILHLVSCLIVFFSSFYQMYRFGIQVLTCQYPSILTSCFFVSCSAGVV